MTGSSVRRTNEAAILGNHEQRITALERSPGRDAIYVDDRVITDPVSVVTFDGFPSNREILELTWQITTDDYPEWLCLLFNGDYPSTGNDYRWRLFGDVTADEGEPGASDSAGLIGGSAIADFGVHGPNWGRIRFPDYNEPTGAHGIIWQGEGGIVGGDGVPSTWIISGCGDPETPLTEINVFASTDGVPDSSMIVAPSRLTLTAY